MFRHLNGFWLVHSEESRYKGSENCVADTGLKPSVNESSDESLLAFATQN